MKVKRSTIHQEIENTSSILESRTSSYVEAFKNLEFQGEQAIQLILDLNRVSRVEQTNIIKKVPVDVTFANNYKPDMSSESLFKSEPQISKSAQVTLNQSRPANVGMQAYIIPEDPIPSILTTELPKMLPYDKGYAMGTNISHNAKTFVKDILIPKINNTVNTYSKKSSGLRPPVLDDQNNTISEMLELAPILNLLDFKTKALKDLIVQHSTIAKSFREYSVIWKDVIDLVGHMENDLYSHISSSVINGPDRIALSILSLCLGNVRTRFEVQVETSKHTNGGNSLFTVLLNEIKAIVTAISMVSGDKSYLQIITDLESMSGINKDQPTSSYKTVSSSYPIPTGFINTGINERAKAEIELSKGKPLEISFPSQYQILKKDKLI